ncbi:MAG: G/U mismatch-specific DNA glycosylase [Phycisphaeraceae bacterium]
MPPREWRPTRAQLEAAKDTRIPDVIARDLDVLFVGINPSLYSAAVGHHFARPGNRFWPALHRAGFTDRQLSPFEDRELLKVGCGITNFVERATARADELSDDELRQGAERLRRKVRRFAPRCVAIVGITAYRTGFGRKHAQVGAQDVPLENARLWVLPNPSGLNAHYQLADLAAIFADLRRDIA